MWLACRDSQGYCVFPSEVPGLSVEEGIKPRGEPRV